MKENYVLLHCGYVFIWVTSPIGFVTGCDWVKLEAFCICKNRNRL